MNFRKLLSLGMLFVASTALCETDFYLKNGSVLTGFVKTQPSTANSEMLIRADKARLCVPQSKVRSVLDPVFTPKEELDTKWIEWADENDGWEYDNNGQQGLTFCDVNLVGMSPSLLKNAHLMSQGSQYEFVLLDQEDYTINSSDVQRKVMSHRRPEIISGTNSEYTIDLGDGTGIERVVGELISVGPDKTYTVLTQGGKRRTFPKSAIISETVSKLNPDQDLLEQVEYIDLIEIKGFQEPKEGVIIVKDHRNRTITLYMDEGHSVKYDLSKIKSYNKRKNNPKLISDHLLQPGQMLINDNVATPTYQVRDAAERLVVIPEANMEHVTVYSDDQLTVHANLTNRKSTEDYVLVELNNVSVYDVPQIKDILNNKNVNRVNMFSYKDIVEKAIEPSYKKTSLKGTTTIEYTLPWSGLYGLYDKVNKDIILINAL